MADTDAGETSGICNLRPRLISPEVTIYIISLSIIYVIAFIIPYRYSQDESNDQIRVCQTTRPVLAKRLLGPMSLCQKTEITDYNQHNSSVSPRNRRRIASSLPNRRRGVPEKDCCTRQNLDTRKLSEENVLLQLKKLPLKLPE